MWNYGEPFPEFDMKPLQSPEWVPYPVVGDIFGGLHSQTGTYFETPGHFPDAGPSYQIDDIPFDKLIDIPVHVLHLHKQFSTLLREAIDAEDIKASVKNHDSDIRPGEALLIDAGWGRYWDADFFLNGPFFSHEAFLLLLAFKPRLMGSDFPRWENLDNMQHIFPPFYDNDVWMLAPVVNLENIEAGLLSVLPLAVDDCCCAPCRAFVRH